VKEKIDKCVHVGGDVNLWLRVAHEIHEHWSPMNIDDSTVFHEEKSLK
jgi:hypothetical protein